LDLQNAREVVDLVIKMGTKNVIKRIVFGKVIARNLVSKHGRVETA
jgi:hypothetical protein